MVGAWRRKIARRSGRGEGQRATAAVERGVCVRRCGACARLLAICFAPRLLISEVRGLEQPQKTRLCPGIDTTRVAGNSDENRLNFVAALLAFVKDARRELQLM